MSHQFVPVLLALVAAFVITAGLLGFSALVATRSRTRVASKRESYESGVPLLDQSWKRIPIKFYAVALVFVVLDVEVAFLYPWAVTYRDFLAENATVVLWDMLAFIALIAFAYAYMWRKGVFDWGRRQPPADSPPSAEGTR
jgi:NADH-quinone oxidoreductase subunit A